MEKELTTLFTGRNIQLLSKTDSTNTFLANLQKKQALPEGSVIRAEHQLAGRGQAGSDWNSVPGQNLLLSFLFYPSFLPVQRLFELNKCYALGISDYLNNYFPDSIKIKWPNDIYWKDKKICGILVENVLNSSGLQQSILGAGINVNQDSFPENLPNPVSMKIISGEQYDLNEELICLCNYVEARYLQLRRGEYDRISKDYESRLYKMGEWTKFERNHDRFEARICGVDAIGRLCLEHKDGLVTQHLLKEIRFL